MTEPVSAAAPAVETKGATILVVEDDPGVARLQRRHLERAGYRVLTAATAEEGLQRVRSCGIDLIVLDYKLPSDHTGLEFHEQLKEAGYQLPVIMVTGFSDEATVIKALRAGVRDFVTKSVEYLDYLPEATDRVLRQVRTERRLAESEARLAAVINSAKDAIIFAETDQRVSLFNPAAERMFRCPAAQALGRPLGHFIRGAGGEPGPDDDPVLHLVQAGARGVRADGEEFPLETSASHVEVEGRKFYAVVVRDITGRLRAEQQIREQAALLDKTADAILVQDLRGRILFWNRGAERLYGWTAAEVVGEDAGRLLHPGGPAEWAAVLATLAAREEWHGELRQLTKVKKEVVTASRATTVPDAAGRPAAVLLISTDITEQKQLEARYLRAQRMESLGTLAGGIAHDLNNVLTPVAMGLDLLKLPMPESERLAILSTLEDSVRRGAELVKQVLLFARGGEGQRLPVQLRPVLCEVEKILRHSLPKAIDIAFTAPEDLWPVPAEATQLAQVLMNLCVNARDAMPAGGRLVVSAENVWLDEGYARMHPVARPGRFVVVRVADTGAGIPPEHLDKIFDPFFTTKAAGQGTGLGLSTVAGIVKGHGGFVTVDSEVGRGTQFAVYLPATEAAGAAEAAGRPDLPPGRGELVLVVDDEASIREVLRATLEAHSYRVLAAKDGAEAVALLAQHRGAVDVVLTDMEMPVMDGVATVRAVRALDPRVRVVAASGLRSHAKVLETDLGVRAFLPKPYTADQLLTTLRTVLAEP
jgi:PAS domain S-box-containing protein